MGGAFAEIEGVARGNPALRAGTPVALVAVGSAFEGKYTLTSTRHVFSEDGYTTSFTVSGRAERSLYGLTGGGTSPGRPPVGGLAPALVTDVRDPRDLGRVKVSFPWLSDRYASGWARTVQLGAGADRGAMILPEVGDEVLVGFEQGDLASPYVLGGLYNGRDLPANSTWDTVDRTSGQVGGRRFVSRTGHRLELVETATADDGVRLATGDGHQHIELDQRGTRVTVHGDGTVRIEGAQGVTVDAGAGALELTGATVSIKATSTARIEGASVTVTGTGSAELERLGHHHRLRRPRPHQLTHPRRNPMPPAARVGDPTGHAGVLGPPLVPTVLIGGQPAATVGTVHTCPVPPPAGPHPPTPVVPPGCPTVLVGGPAGRPPRRPHRLRRPDRRGRAHRPDRGLTWTPTSSAAGGPSRCAPTPPAASRSSPASATSRRSIRIILGTAPGERPMRPEFGCGIHELVFAPADATTAGQLAFRVRAALERWEPRIDLDDVVVRFDEQDAGRLLIDIRYSLGETNDPRNLVFPFYVIPDHESLPPGGA